MEVEERPLPRRRRWTQLSLRTFLMVAIVVGVVVSWYGRQYQQNQDDRSKIVATQWDIQSGENVLWSVPLGSQTYSRPVVSGGRVFIGSNNGHGYVARFPSTTDLGVVLCFAAADGKFLWQASFAKLPSGRVNDWPMQGVASTPLVEGDRLWVVTNRSQVVCLDTHGFHDQGQNDGPYQKEPNTNLDEADILWEFDMIGKLGTFPHNMSHCRVVTAGHRLFVVTSNGVDESHNQLPSAQAPSFICLDKRTGKLLWQDASPGGNVLHGQWGSPLVAVLGGTPQVLFPGGDGWLYSFDPRGDGKGGGKLLWKFDCNPKTSRWMLGGRGTRNNLIARPTVYDGRVYIAVGQDPEHGEGGGHIWCIDPTRRGDISSEIVVRSSARPSFPRRLQSADVTNGDKLAPNPNSGLIWHFDQSDTNGNGKIDGEERMHRSLSDIMIKNDIVIATDFTGYVHCLDARTGKSYWNYDLLAACWATPLIAGEHVYVGDEDGDIAVFKLSADPNVAMVLGSPHSEINMGSSVYSTPLAANNVLYVATRNTLFAIRAK